MKRIFILFTLTILTFSCNSTKQVVKVNEKHIKVDRIIDNANYYKGTKYKYGGTTKKGMDCSGLIYTAFKKENILLPRVSRDMANKGIKVSLKQIRKGDLLFFATGKTKRITHVGLVTKITHGEVVFIHASSSRGVVSSSMSEKYYKIRFVKAKRILF